MNIEEYALHCDDADDEPSECKVCANNGNDYCFACDNGNQFKPITNGERIRSMNDEGLAKWFCVMNIDDCPDKAHELHCTDKCYECWLDWLKQEVDDGT